MRVLVTGANGFIGRGLVERLAGIPGLQVRAAVRSTATRLPAGVEVVATGDLDKVTDWRALVADVDVVVHAAARVHVMGDSGTEALHLYRSVNVDTTMTLARQALQSGARRFIFISSIKVNGEVTSPGKPFRPEDPPNPADAYGLSKHEAEQGLAALAESTGLETVILRPVLVYGPGVGGNFRSLINLVRKSLPLPLASVHNARSFVARDNLVDLIVRCLDHPAAANQTFLVSDGRDLSTPELITALGKAMGRKVFLLPVPPALLSIIATVIGKRPIIERLCGSLQVDMKKTEMLLGWSPPVSVSSAIADTVDDFLGRGGR